MTAPDRADLVRLIRAELEDCEPEACVEERSSRACLDSVGRFSYPLNVVRAQFHQAQAANWRDFGRRLRELLAELGETP